MPRRKIEWADAVSAAAKIWAKVYGASDLPRKLRSSYYRLYWAGSSAPGSRIGVAAMLMLAGGG